MPKAFAEVDFSDSCSEGLMDGIIAGKRRGSETKTAQDLPAWRMPRCHWRLIVLWEKCGWPVIGSRLAYGITVIQIQNPALRLQGQLVLTSRVIPRSTESRLGQLYIYDPSTKKKSA